MKLGNLDKSLFSASLELFGQSGKSKRQAGKYIINKLKVIWSLALVGVIRLEVEQHDIDNMESLNRTNSNSDLLV